VSPPSNADRRYPASSFLPLFGLVLGEQCIDCEADAGALSPFAPSVAPFFKAHDRPSTHAKQCSELVLFEPELLACALHEFVDRLHDDHLRYVASCPLAVHIGWRTAPSRAALEACPSPDTSLTFLTNEWGRPFSSHGFGDWFRKQVAAAGLGEHCVAHGLRKAACRIMAENNCTAHEIKSVSDHRTLKEVERYTDAVNNRRLAAQARAKVAAGKVVPLSVAS
jgi:hypothetical protein